jgi:hypothetical protein
VSLTICLGLFYLPLSVASKRKRVDEEALYFDDIEDRVSKMEGQLAGFRKQVKSEFSSIRELLLERLPPPGAARSTPAGLASRKGDARNDGLVMPKPKRRKVKEEDEEDGEDRDVKAAHKKALSVRR